MVPMGFRWAKGLKVNRPSSLAVVSPSLYATHPCANSCTGKQQNTTKQLERIEISASR